MSHTTTYHSESDATSSDIVTDGQVLVRLNLRRADGVPGGPQATAGTARGFCVSASDVTVVP